jgi:hypothetical protein
MAKYDRQKDREVYLLDALMRLPIATNASTQFNFGVASFDATGCNPYPLLGNYTDE